MNEVLWLYATSYKCSWSGWLIWLLLWSTRTNCPVYSLHFNMQNALMVQRIVALRSFCHSQVDKWTISRMTRIQGKERYLFSRGSLCWQIGMSPNNISGDYLYNDVLLHYMITAIKGFHQVTRGISMLLIAINGKDCTGTWLTHCYYCGRCIIYYMCTCTWTRLGTLCNYGSCLVFSVIFCEITNSLRI